jgi:hypothetical protein
LSEALLHFQQIYVLQGRVVSPTPNPRAGSHLLSFVSGCLFNIFAAGGRYSIRNLVTRHAVDKDPSNMGVHEQKKVEYH